MMSKTAVTYRRASYKDREGLSKLRIAAYAEYANALTKKNWDILNGSLHDEAKLDDLIAKATVFVCVDNAEIVGMAFIIPSGNPTPIFKTEWAHIRMVGVHPGSRGQGIAKMLTQMCIHHARLTNEKTIALHTSEFMDAARHIYESLGFCVLKEIDKLFGKRYWLYTLDL